VKTEWLKGRAGFAALLSLSLLASCPNPAITVLDQVKPPVIAPAGGTFGDDVTVTITTDTPGALIRYATNGLDPSSTKGNIYAGPFSVIFSGPVRAIAYKDGMRDSNVTCESYEIRKPPGQLDAPEFGLAPGTYPNSIWVSMSTRTSKVVIRYTTDGSDPSANNGTDYAKPISVERHTVFKAIAMKSGWLDSAIASAEYSFRVALPDFNPPGSVYASLQSLVAISSATDGATIHFTQDGSMPDPATSDEYTTPVPVQGRMTLKAIASREGWVSSNVATTSYLMGKLIASDGVASAYFGTSIALARGGNTAIAGSPNIAGEGAAYIFIGNGQSWTQAQELSAPVSDGYPGFGVSVSSSDDGKTFVIGDPNAQIGANTFQGAAYVYAFIATAGKWQYVGQLIVADGASDDHLGFSAAISGDGQTIAVGAPKKTIGGKPQQGAVYIYSCVSGSWQFSQELVASDGDANDLFGSSLSLSSDGSLIAIGAYYDWSGPGQGAQAYLFEKSGDSWLQAQEISASDGTFRNTFGYSISLSSSGDTVAVGAYAVSSYRGAAYIFDRSGGPWSQSARLAASDGTGGDYFGISVSLSTGGDVLIVGSPCSTIAGVSQQGAAYVFSLAAGSWSEPRKLSALDAGPEAANSQFGRVVSLRGDGALTLVGVPYLTIGAAGYNQGAAYFSQ
jgi:hypothetical protein